MESDQVLYFDPPDRLLLEDFLPCTRGPVAATSPDLDGRGFDPEQAGQRGSRNALRASRPGLTLPHLTLTYAMSLDCKISLARGAPTALSGSRTRAMTHYLRSRHDAILIGVGTAETDDPSLNSRFSADGVNKLDLEEQPIPVILDPNGRWGCRRDCKVLQLARSGKGKAVLWIVSRAKVASIDAARQSNLDGAGAVIALEEPDGDRVVEWGSLLQHLSRRGITSLMVEGGGRVIADLLREHNHRWVSSVVITIAPVWLGKSGVDVSPTRRSGAENKEVGRLETVSWLPLRDSVDGVIAGRFGPNVVL